MYSHFTCRHNFMNMRRAFNCKEQIIFSFCSSILLFLYFVKSLEAIPTTCLGSALHNFDNQPIGNSLNKLIVAKRTQRHKVSVQLE